MREKGTAGIFPSRREATDKGNLLQIMLRDQLMLHFSFLSAYLHWTDGVDTTKLRCKGESM
jgi:hypothetical protein